jgi:putative tryptophan/tyrosine transport system substrate-binding protein
MRRREFITLLSAATTWPFAALAQQLQPKKMPLLGFLSAGPPPPGNPSALNFLRGLRDLGYVDGSNIQIDARYTGGRADLLPELAVEMVHLKPDVLVTVTAVGALAVKKATSTIPTVAIATHDGVRFGIYESLARPGGNITGIDTLSEAADAKRVTMLKEIRPQLSRLTILLNPLDLHAPAHLENTQVTLKTLGIAGQVIEVRRLEDFDSAFDAMRTDLPQAIVVFLDGLFIAARQRIVDFTTEHKIPMIGEDARFVRLGQLISYGAALDEVFYRAGYYVDRLLKGANPATFPVEQPTRISLAINLKTAKAFGMKLPDTLVALADEVIE